MPYRTLARLWARSIASQRGKAHATLPSGALKRAAAVPGIAAGPEFAPPRRAGGCPTTSAKRRRAPQACRDKPRTMERLNVDSPLDRARTQTEDPRAKTRSNLLPVACANGSLTPSRLASRATERVNCRNNGRSDQNPFLREQERTRCANRGGWRAGRPSRIHFGRRSGRAAAGARGRRRRRLHDDRSGRSVLRAGLRKRRRARPRRRGAAAAARSRQAVRLWTAASP